MSPFRMPVLERIELWQWGFLLVAVFAGLVVGKLASALLVRMARRASRHHWGVRATVCHDAASPVSLTLLTTGLLVGLRFLQLEGAPATLASKLVEFLYILGFGWFLYNLVDLVELSLHRVARGIDNKLPEMAVPLVRKALRVFVFLIFTLVVAQNVFGLNIAGWLAGLGIAGLAVSLAAQDSLKNVFGSMVIFFDHPFSAGDWIIFGDYEGYVEEIGFRSTRMRLWSRNQVTIPNLKFNDNEVINVTRRPLDRRVMDITVTYDTPPHKMREAVQIIEEILREPEVCAQFDFEQYPPHIAFDKFNSASLNIRVYYYFIRQGNQTYWDYFDQCHLFNMKLLHRFNEAGIDFAFPTQTLHLAGDDKRQLSVRVLRDGQSATTEEASPRT